MNFKKSNKQSFLLSHGFILFSMKIKEKCLNYIKEFAVFGLHAALSAELHYE